MKNTNLLVAIAMGMLAGNVIAETPEEKGLSIATETDRRDKGFGNSSYEATMVLRNKQGEESMRHFFLRTLEIADDGDKDLGIFDSPPDVKGTAILTYSHGLQPDDQWIFLPDVKRVKRISSVNKSGPFMGSEFAFEDIASWELSKYSYKYVRDENFDGNDCFVVENTPVYEHSGYSRQLEWVDKKIYQPRKIEFYDRKDALLKTLVLKDYREFLGTYWRPHQLIMTNTQSGKTTTLTRANYQFRTQVSEQDFTESALKAVR